MPVDLLVSFLALLLGLSGVILSLSGMVNSYQKKKLEYIAYRNQGKAKTLLDGSEPTLNIATEAQYYRDHNLGGEAIIDINFITHGLKTDFFKVETYTNFFRDSFTRVAEFLTHIDLGLLSKQSKVWLSKALKYLKSRYTEIVAFLMKITQPIDPNDVTPDHSSVRSAMATSSRIKNLNQTFQNLTDKSQEFIKTRFSKTKVDVWPNQTSEITMDQNYKESFSSVSNKSSTTTTANQITEEDEEIHTETDAMVYQQLEDEILDKLHLNLTDFQLWESLGDFYNQHKEHNKAREVFNYINKHSQDEAQLNRLKNKF